MEMDYIGKRFDQLGICKVRKGMAFDILFRVSFFIRVYFNVTATPRSEYVLSQAEELRLGSSLAVTGCRKLYLEDLMTD